VTSLVDMPQAIADALQPLTLEVDGLQIYPGWNDNPSPPCIDVYPGDPFQQPAGYGIGNNRAWWIVRALVATSDMQAANQLLLRFLDPNDPASVEAALAVNDTATVDSINGSISGFRKYADAAGAELLGCQWQVGTYLS
jgi:hypothetical protein